MDKRVILSVAGAGKTYTICQEIDENKRNVIIAYTKQNIKNIENELLKKHKCIPRYTKIYTFHKFIYNFFIRPYENKISEFYKEKVKSKGLSFKEPQKAVNTDGKYNFKYSLQKDIKHFMVDNRFYSSRISELVNYLSENNCKIFDKAINQLNIFFDNLYIDEFQDFREDNYKLLENIINGCKNVLLVGDYYQHSVSAVNNTGIPFQRQKKNKTTNKMEKFNISYDDYINLLVGLNLSVDNKTLIKSRRCSEEICKFISRKLEIKIESEKINQGGVIFIKDEEEAKKFLNDDSVIKLVYQQPYIWQFNAISWSYSKGDTYTNSLVILTDKFDGLDTDKFSINNIPPTTLNKVYVAMTRTDSNLYLLKCSIFNKIKEDFQKPVYKKPE